MARIRTIKPEFWRDEALSAVSPETALMAIGLLNVADDEGCFSAHPKLLESDIFPLRELSGSVPGMLSELSQIGYVELFLGTDGKKYGRVTNFTKHQVINKKTPSKIKDLLDVREDSGSGVGGLPSGKERKGREGKGEDAPPRKRSAPPAITLNSYLEECETNNAKPIPDDHYIRAWATDAGITIDMVKIAWVQFKDRYTTDSNYRGKKQKDWPAHFANCVKGNWFGVWYIDADGVKWSSKGLGYKAVADKQAERLEEASHA